MPERVSGAPPGRRVCPSTMYRAGMTLSGLEFAFGLGFELPFGAALAMGVNVFEPTTMGSRTAGGFVI